MDEKALIILAEMLGKARIQANAIDVTAPQAGVYGDIANALKQTLVLLAGDYKAGLIYQALLDGSSVEEALYSYF